MLLRYLRYPRHFNGHSQSLCAKLYLNNSQDNSMLVRENVTFLERTLKFLGGEQYSRSNLTMKPF